ncbi:uncharacterized protein BT62DRAFT_1010144 [Guyanagaster necrorhizus]|uniref:Uncharacterized protein n=1 Tax=Guyanagaster necrorhizus TaxID=856835 RepID=A0A9P7VL96_9AGAR|nr:uncharacterized protein BT62DRAFT_1010144 [Guyanagaster necrorhizus MCA 3950]KAG7442557.1 hypothetical protein BT62DRAFT_1010144 [Guyanagaster necrorhizus MCA 3950]
MLFPDFSDWDTVYPSLALDVFRSAPCLRYVKVSAVPSLILPWNQLRQFIAEVSPSWEHHQALLQNGSNLETLCMCTASREDDTDTSFSYPAVTLPRLRVVESGCVPSNFLDSATLPELKSITGIYNSAIPSLSSMIRRSNCTLTHLSLSSAKDTADLMHLLRLCLSLKLLRIKELVIAQLFFNTMAQTSSILPSLEVLNLYQATCSFEGVSEMVEMMAARRSHLKNVSIALHLDGTRQEGEWLGQAEKARIHELSQLGMKIQMERNAFTSLFVPSSPLESYSKISVHSTSSNRGVSTRIRIQGHREESMHGHAMRSWYDPRISVSEKVPLNLFETPSCDDSIRTIKAISFLVRVSDNDGLWLASSTGGA